VPRSGRAARLALAALAAAVVTGPARAADLPSVDPRGSRDVSTLTSREAVLTEQAAGAQAAVRWRLRALYRLVVAGGELPASTRARAVDAVTRVLARELAEARSLGDERAQLRTERDALETAARADEAIGAAPVVVAPVAGTILARFGVAPERDTGVLVPRAGLRLAAIPRAAARAPVAGLVALVADEPEGAAVVVDAGAGWSTIVSGLADVAVARGDRVAVGQRLGVAGGAAVSFEVWRGRRPVDPSLLLRASPAPLAAPARLP
jgi:septal ring factor EnvC (AmiA/AmiB activator)